MFIGHFAVGFAAKKFAPKSSLAVLLAAPMVLDILWPLFLALGWEHVRLVPGITRYNDLDLYDFPWSHSLLMSLVWASAFAWIYHVATHYRPGTIAVWIGVVSHWVLDFISHRPDLPLYPGGGPHLGLGLWNSVAGTMSVEIVMLATGVYLYASSTRAKDRIGTYAFATYVVVLLFLYVSDRFGSSPPNVSDIVWTATIAEIVLLVWPWWFDRHRRARRASGLVGKLSLE
jgi:hypothetical protein